MHGYMSIRGETYQYHSKPTSSLITESGRALSQTVTAGTVSSPGQVMWDIHGEQDGRFPCQFSFHPLHHIH
jgi:hypothetical protein